MEFVNKVSHASADDKYTASIDLSNKCREFYKSRVEAAHCIKSKWEKEAAHQSDSPRNDNDRPLQQGSCTTTSSSSVTQQSQRRKRSSIEEAMDKLKAEMSSLMDQDLSLMKQLLTLNETIEDLKWQRRYYSSPRSSADLHDDDESDCSISDTEMYESEDDLRFFSSPTAAAPTSTANPASLSATATPTIPSTSCRKLSVSSYKGEMRCPESPVVVMAESSLKVYHGEQDSFDSGIHEHCSGSSSSSGEEEAVLEASV